MRGKIILGLCQSCLEKRESELGQTTREPAPRFRGNALKKNQVTLDVFCLGHLGKGGTGGKRKMNRRVSGGT